MYLHLSIEESDASIQRDVRIAMCSFLCPQIRKKMIDGNTGNHTIHTLVKSQDEVTMVMMMMMVIIMVVVVMMMKTDIWLCLLHSAT